MSELGLQILPSLQVAFCAFCATLDCQCFEIKATNAQIVALDAAAEAEICAEAKTHKTAAVAQVVSLFDFWKTRWLYIEFCLAEPGQWF